MILQVDYLTNNGLVIKLLLLHTMLHHPNYVFQTVQSFPEAMSFLVLVSQYCMH